MIRLQELWRQLLAGFFAAGAFGFVYLLLALKWLPAIAIAFAVYIALLLLIERQPEDSEVLLPEHLNQDDLQKAVDYCRTAAKQLSKVSRVKSIDADTASAIQKLAQLVERIADNYQDDPRDLKHSIPLIKHYLPKLLSIVQDFEQLSKKLDSTQQQQRLRKIATRIQSYVPHFQAIYDACLENDFKRLELESDVLGDVMKIQQR
jgi:DNA repair ATPase RecN